MNLSMSAMSQTRNLVTVVVSVAAPLAVLIALIIPRYAPLAQTLELSFLEIPQSTSDIEVDDGYLFLAQGLSRAGDGALRVIDVRDPEHPTEVGLFPTPAPVRDVTIVDDLAYLAERSRFIGGNLRILDVSNRRAPVELGSIPIAATDVEIQDGIAIVAEYIGIPAGQLALIDVSDPAHPARLGSLRTPTVINDVHVVDGLVYLAAGVINIEVGKLIIVDPSNPFEPVTVGSIDIPGNPFDVEVVGDRAYLISHISSVSRDLEVPGSFRIIDVSTPENPKLLDTKIFEFDRTRVRTIEVLNGVAYTALEGFDLTRPLASPPLTTLNSRETTGDVALHENLAFLANGGGPVIPSFLPGSQPIGLQILDLGPEFLDPDRDEVASVVDNCSGFPNPDQADRNEDLRGDLCQCGDASGDGLLTSMDVAGAAMCANGLVACDPSLVDADGDGSTTALDLGGIVSVVNEKISSIDLACDRAREVSD